MTLPATATGILTINLGALADNWRLLNQRAAPARAAAVIKANGYGLGIEIVARALFDAGCRMFFVAHPNEGLRAREALPAEARLYVLNGLQAHADATRDYAAHGLAPVIGSAAELARFQKANTGRRPAPFALHLDTGMNRLGFQSAAGLKAAVAAHGARGADLLMTHLVSAEDSASPLNARQLAAFREARAEYPNLQAALANSSGIFLQDGAGFDWVRPGFALYGGNPTPGKPNPMRAVVTLDVVIQQTRWIKAGETCGYNARWTARRRTRLATLLAGYADGLPFGAGATDERPGAKVLIGGVPCPLVGRISMDLVIADVTDVPEEKSGPGAWARLIGPDAPLDAFAEASATIGYQVLTTLGSRYARVVKD